MVGCGGLGVTGAGDKGTKPVGSAVGDGLTGLFAGLFAGLSKGIKPVGSLIKPGFLFPELGDGDTATTS